MSESSPPRSEPTPDSSPPPAAAAPKSRNPVRRLYEWTVQWAQTPYGLVALALVAFVESSFFPIPPDPLLMALCVASAKKSLRLAAVCTVASVLGGAFGYWLGDTLLRAPILEVVDFFSWQKVFGSASAYYHHYDAWAVGMAALTPIPYKVFTILAGYLRIDFPVFLLASVAGRGARFFAVGALFYFFGKPIARFIERYLNLLTVAFFVLLIGAFFVLGGVRTEIVPDAARVDQLLVSLDADDPGTTQVAILELQKETGEWFGYDEGAPSDQRAAAIERWRQWWKEARPTGEDP